MTDVQERERPTPEERLHTAHGLVNELYELMAIERYGALPWLSAMRDIRTSLNDEDLAIPDRLAEAFQTVGIMYKGGRNFSDFHFYRENWNEMNALNTRLERLMTELKQALRGQATEQ